MIKTISQERIGQPKKGFVSFKLKFTDEELSKENVEDLRKKLSKYESRSARLKDGSSYEYDINVDEKIINIIIHYPLKKWPFEEQRDVKMMNDFADDFLEFYKKEIV